MDSVFLVAALGTVKFERFVRMGRGLGLQADVVVGQGLHVAFQVMVWAWLCPLPTLHSLLEGVSTLEVNAEYKQNKRLRYRPLFLAHEFVSNHGLRIATSI